MGESKKNGMKTAVVVAGALAFAWLTIEIACKPFLQSARDAIARSDPDHDPDPDQPPVQGNQKTASD